MKKAYQKYKELPFPWPNQIPADWELAKISSAFTERKETVSDKDFEPLSVTKDGIVPQLDTAAKTDNGDNRKKVLAGDFVINSRSDRKGSSGLSRYDGSVSVINTVLKPLQDKAEGKYIEYLLKNYFFQEEFYRYGKGIVDDLWSTKYSNMKGMPIPLPSLPEQRQIAAFLDHKCALIDTFIQKKTRLIELLKEQKQAIINKAVTKGIDPNVRLKPSGIDWLGDIPEHWEVKKLKYLLKISGRIGFRGYNASDLVSEGEGAITLSPSNIKDSQMDYSSCSYLSWEKYYESPEIQASIGDILFVKTGSSYGKSALISSLPMEATINPQLVLFKSILLNGEFFQYALYSDSVKNQINTSVIGGTIPTISQSKIGNYFIAFPNSGEQDEIVAYIKKETFSIDKAIRKVEQEIELIQEYKTTLIAEAVTGKIDARDWKPKQVAEELEQTLNQVQAYGSN